MTNTNQTQMQENPIVNILNPSSLLIQDFSLARQSNAETFSTIQSLFLMFRFIFNRIKPKPAYKQ